MPQEDKIKREIDRIGLALAKILSRLLHKDYPHSDAVLDIGGQLSTELDIDLERRLTMGANEAPELLIKDKQFSMEHLRSFGNLLYELAYKTADKQKRVQLLDKALVMYEYINANSRTSFLDVVYRIQELKEGRVG